MSDPRFDRAGVTGPQGRNPNKDEPTRPPDQRLAVEDALRELELGAELAAREQQNADLALHNNRLLGVVRDTEQQLQETQLAYRLASNRADEAERQLQRITHNHYLAEVEARDLRGQLTSLREALEAFRLNCKCNHAHNAADKVLGENDSG